MSDPKAQLEEIRHRLDPSQISGSMRLPVIALTRVVDELVDRLDALTERIEALNDAAERPRWPYYAGADPQEPGVVMGPDEFDERVAKDPEVDAPETPKRKKSKLS